MIPSSVFEFFCPTRIVHGIGSVAHLGHEVQALGGRHALIVTDPGIVGAGLLEPVVQPLEKIGLQHTGWEV